MRAYAVAAAASGLVVAGLRPELVRWAPAFVVPLGVGLWAAAHRRERDLLAGLATVAGSCVMTVVAFDAGPAATLARGWQLAAVQFLYFAGTVFYVKTVIRERDNPRFLAASVAAHLAATLALTVASLWLGAVFLLLTIRAWLVPRWRPRPAQVGIGEVGLTVLVGAVSLAVL